WHLGAVPDTDILILNQCEWYQDKLQWVQKAIYIANSLRKNSSGQLIVSLFSKILGSEREELLEGVDNIKINYGVVDATSKDISFYAPANQVQNWKAVRAVQIELVLNSV